MAETRKTVTVLFADVVGSTALGEALDLEAVRRLMERFSVEARSAIDHHGGTVEKFVGDAVMAGPRSIPSFGERGNWLSRPTVPGRWGMRGVLVHFGPSSTAFDVDSTRSVKSTVAKTRSGSFAPRACSLGGHGQHGVRVLRMG
jgi:class 3 adenylate cyclase